MNSLELYSGSATFSQIATKHGFSSWSVDWNKKYNPSICCDILQLDYSLLPEKINVLWASPDCSRFSRNGNSKHWVKHVLKYRQYFYEPITVEAVRALNQVSRTFDIIDHYKPDFWWVENPVGRMRHLECVKKFVPFRYSINYKDWGFPYSKETDIYTNVLLPLSVKKVIRPGLSVASLNSSYARSVVPGQFIDFLFNNFVNPYYYGSH